MSLIKNWLLDMQQQQDAINEAKLLLTEYKLFSSLSPMNHDYSNRKETSSR
jgi:hypothetical protein